MPNTTEGLLLLIGGLFLMIGLIGGGFEVSAAKIPPVGKKGRIGSSIAGIIFLTLAIRSIALHEAQTAPSPPPSAPKQATTDTNVPDASIVKQSSRGDAGTRETTPRERPPQEGTEAQHATIEEPPRRTDTNTGDSSPMLATVLTPVGNRYYRLQLKHDDQYLDAAYCSDKLTLNPGSDFDGGSCELFRFIPGGNGWSRVQLMNTGRYLDACATEAVSLNAISTVGDGACQLWQLVSAGDGWSRLRSKQGQYLDAQNCTAEIGLSSISDLEEGACQMWRLVPQWETAG